MLNSILLAAALLLGGHSMPKTQATVEPRFVSAPVVLHEAMMTDAIEKLLIEAHAAPHWDLSVSLAWSLYREGLIVITEIEVDVRYRITYNGGILDVVLDDDM